MSHIEKALRRAGVARVWSDSLTAVADKELAREPRLDDLHPPAVSIDVAPASVAEPMPVTIREMPHVVPREPAHHADLEPAPRVVEPSLAAPLSFRLPKTFQGIASDTARVVVTSPTASPQLVEQFRALGARLHQQPRSSGVVMVTSAIAGEGKTFTALNLALTLSESYRRRVVIVDADLRRPSLHRVLGQPIGDGLANVLMKGEPRGLRGVTQNLAALTAGAVVEDPIAVLTTERLPRVLSQLAGLFDWVVLDTPPVGPLPDAGLLAEHAHTILFVVQAGRTPYSVAQRAVESLGHDRVQGIILNRFTTRRTADSYTYASYYTQPSNAAEDAWLR
jgi:capsular exopolysaccharide synthesis family protein